MAVVNVPMLFVYVMFAPIFPQAAAYAAGLTVVAENDGAVLSWDPVRVHPKFVTVRGAPASAGGIGPMSMSGAATATAVTTLRMDISATPSGSTDATET